MREFKKYFNNTKFLIGLFMVGFLFLVMLIGIVYLPYDPLEYDVLNKLSKPSSLHLLGTDELGRDILSRVMKGARTSFFIGFSVVVIGFILGGTLGALAGYYGGKVDNFISKIIDVQMAFPGVLIAMMLIASLNSSLFVLILALGIMAIPRFARMTRSGFLEYKEMQFTKAAKAKGASDFKIMFVHILPNIQSRLLISATLSFSSAIMSEAGLSYLGLGIAPPEPSFGKMLSDAQGVILSAPWYVFIPSSIIIMLVLGFNLMADGIEDVNKF